jgi:protein required for attachment to host cells
MQYLYKEFVPIYHMSGIVWKCYRCNLSFKDKNLAEIHKEISKHSVTKIKAIVA